MINNIEVLKHTNGDIFFENVETREIVQVDYNLKYYFRDATPSAIKQLLAVAFDLVEKKQQVVDEDLFDLNDETQVMAEPIMAEPKKRKKTPKGEEFIEEKEVKNEEDL